MKFILEYKKFSDYDIGDVVNIHYWYNNMVTPVVIVEKVGKRYKVSHDVPKSKIQNAPEEVIGTKDIISIVR